MNLTIKGDKMREELIDKVMKHPLALLIRARAQKYEQYAPLEEALIAGIYDMSEDDFADYESDLEWMIDNVIHHNLQSNANKEEV